MPDQGERKAIPLKVPADLADALEAEAKKRGVSRNALAVTAFEAFLGLGPKRPEKATADAAGKRWRGCAEHPRAGATESRGRWWCKAEGCPAPARPA